MTQRIVVIGAGIGGLTTAALLAKDGFDVTVLEALKYPGGCAGTFHKKGYRFDAGATLAAGFAPAGGLAALGEELGITWPVEPAEVAMRVHLPDGTSVIRWTDPAAWRDERMIAFGRRAEPFWRWQERTAGFLWDLALAGVPWPPQNRRDLGGLAVAGVKLTADARSALPVLALDALRPVVAHLRGASRSLRTYIDGQLLISAQVTSARANALYGAAALDMPRRGVVHVRGGMGRLAEMLVYAVQRHGGTVHLRQPVKLVRRQAGRYCVETDKGEQFEADLIVFNLPPHDAAALLRAGEQPLPGKLAGAKLPTDGWSAFMVHVGLDGSGLPADLPLHHQVLVRQPLGEGNSVFLSLSLPDDASEPLLPPGSALPPPASPPEPPPLRMRGPEGHRTLTISTHTDLRRWWRLFETDIDAYAAAKAEMTERVLAAAELALPGLRAAARLILPGTPVTFQKYTRRSRGWVGGFPQTSLGRAWGPRLDANCWLVGDSIFPGQSVLATALGGRRVAAAIALELQGRGR
jgi:phytoene dehydrogenase-like protein